MWTASMNQLVKKWIDQQTETMTEKERQTEKQTEINRDTDRQVDRHTQENCSVFFIKCNLIHFPSGGRHERQMNV